MSDDASLGAFCVQSKQAEQAEQTEQTEAQELVCRGGRSERTRHKTCKLMGLQRTESRRRGEMRWRHVDTKHGKRKIS